MKETTPTTGWIDRDGNFYPCGYGEHVKFSEKIGFTEQELEQKGWVKVTHLNNNNENMFVAVKRLSEAQEKYLIDIGFDKKTIDLYLSH